MNQFWNDVDIEEIKSFSGVGGGSDSGYFIITMKDDSEKRLDFDSRYDAYQNLYAVKEIYNAYHNVPESYTIENEAFIEINGSSEKFGYLVKDATGRPLDITILQAKEYKKWCKLVETRNRNMSYRTMGKIEFGKVIWGKVDDNFIAQLRTLEYEFPIEKGIYKDGVRVEEVE